jgi:hypothetical protein
MTDPEAALSRRINALKLTRDGASFTIEADAPQRDAIAAALGLPAILAFSAILSARAAGAGRYGVEGEVKARVRQTCVVSGEDFDSDVSAPVEAAFADDERLPPPTKKEVERSLADEDPPEPLDGGHIDIGALAVEFLALGLDPFPRRPGAIYEEIPETEPREGPFAALASLKAGRSR